MLHQNNTSALTQSHRRSDICDMIRECWCCLCFVLLIVYTASTETSHVGHVQAISLFHSCWGCLFLVCFNFNCDLKERNFFIRFKINVFFKHFNHNNTPNKWEINVNRQLYCSIIKRFFHNWVKGIIFCWIGKKSLSFSNAIASTTE